MWGKPEHFGVNHPKLGPSGSYKVLRVKPLCARIHLKGLLSVCLVQAKRRAFGARRTKETGVVTQFRNYVGGAVFVSRRGGA